MVFGVLASNLEIKVRHIASQCRRDTLGAQEYVDTCFQRRVDTRVFGP